MNLKLREFLKGFGLGVISLILIAGLIYLIYSSSDNASGILNNDSFAFIFYSGIFGLYTLLSLFVLKKDKWFKFGLMFPVIILLLALIHFILTFSLSW